MQTGAKFPRFLQTHWSTPGMIEHIYIIYIAYPIPSKYDIITTFGWFLWEL